MTEQQKWQIANRNYRRTVHNLSLFSNWFYSKYLYLINENVQGHPLEDINVCQKTAVGHMETPLSVLPAFPCISCKIFWFLSSKWEHWTYESSTWLWHPQQEELLDAWSHSAAICPTATNCAAEMPKSRRKYCSVQVYVGRSKQKNCICPAIAK